MHLFMNFFSEWTIQKEIGQSFITSSEVKCFKQNAFISFDTHFGHDDSYTKLVIKHAWNTADKGIKEWLTILLGSAESKPRENQRQEIFMVSLSLVIITVKASVIDY